MFKRNVLLTIGVFALFAGCMLLVLGLGQSSPSKGGKTETHETKSFILVATHLILAGTLLRPEDMAWKEVSQAEITEGNLVRGTVSDTDFIGAVTRRDFRDKEAFDSNAIVKARDRGFLSAVLSPGYRAVSLGVDEAQGVSGLIIPGDHVDVILTQNLSDKEGSAAHKSVGETILYNRRVIAVDRLLAASSQPTASEQRVAAQNTGGQRTITLELTAHEAERLLVAAQIGKVALSMRALEGSGMESSKPESEIMPVWASDVSPALRSLEQAPMRSNAPTGSAHGLIEVIHGDKIELR